MAVLRLREAREAAGKTQSELAAECKVNQRQISFWENGQSQPNIDNLVKLAMALNCTLEDLVEY